MIRRVMLWCCMPLLLTIGGCEHPVDIVRPHIEMADLLMEDTTGTVVLRTVNNKHWSDTLFVMTRGQTLKLVGVPLDFKGRSISLDDRDDFELRLEAENGAIIQWEPQAGYGLLRALAPGRTRVRFLVWHLTHADFVTPWLDVDIRASGPLF